MKNLKLEILAQNSLKAFAQVVIAQILPQLLPFLGKKIFTASGDKTKAFESAFLLHIDLGRLQPEPIEGMTVKSHMTYLTCDYGRLDLKVGICLNGEGFCNYKDYTISIGLSKNGQILDSLNTLENIIKSHGLDEVLDFENELSKIRQYKYLLRTAEEAKEKIKVAAEFYKYID